MKRGLIVTAFIFVFVLISFASAEHPDYPGFNEKHFEINGNTLTTSDKLVYQTGYVSINGGAWQEINLQGNQYEGYAFLLDGGQATLPNELNDPGKHFVIVFSCGLENSAWNCHGDTPEEIRWQLEVIENEDPECTDTCASLGYSCGTYNICGISTYCGECDYEGEVPANFKVGIIGDQGLGSSARAVLQLMEDEGVDLILHQGDFDYQDSPITWDNQITQVLGDDFPYFASIGNHDTSAWGGYKQVLNDRLSKIPDVQCTGPENGVKFSCTYKGLFFVLSGVGTMGSGHEEYLESSLASSNADWKFCSWHKNQRLMQVGGKPNEVGWDAYDICREHGALIVTGHEHSYSRTHAMSNFETQSIHSTSNTVLIDEGVTFAVVSGIAGYSIRVQNDNLADNPWWGKVYTSDQGAEYGALICELNINGNPRQGRCYFKAINDYIADDFYLDNRVNI